MDAKLSSRDTAPAVSRIAGRSAPCRGKVSRNGSIILKHIMNWHGYISSDPGVCHGQACIKGTRIPVSVVLDNLAAGIGEAELAASYPALSITAIRAAAAMPRSWRGSASFPLAIRMLHEVQGRRESARGCGRLALCWRSRGHQRTWAADERCGGSDPVRGLPQRASGAVLSTQIVRLTGPAGRLWNMRIFQY